MTQTPEDWLFEKLLELAVLRVEVKRLKRLVVEHHSVGAMDGSLVGDACPVCAASPETLAGVTLDDLYRPVHGATAPGRG